MAMISSAHIIGGRALGGAERFYIRLVNALVAGGQPTLAINVANGQISAALRPDLAQVHIPMRSVWDLPSRWRIKRILRRHQPDIVQTYMGRATRLTHLPQGERPVHVARLGGYYDLKGFRHAHAWVGNTQGICDYLVKNGLPASRVACIGNFVSLPPANSLAARSELRQQLAIPGETLLIVAVGRLHPVKGFEDLLKAFALLPISVSNRPIYLIIVGEGPLGGRLRRYADELEIGNRVRWAGWQNEPGPFYELADLFVCPSRYEPLGNVILEAWSHRKPVLSTRTAGPLEIAAHQDNAWLTPIEDPRALADAIQLLLEDEPLREQLAASGHRKVLAHHSQDAVVAAYLDFYARLLRM